MVINQFNKAKKGTCYQERNYLRTGLPANFWVYELQRKNAPNCTGRIAEYRSRVNNHCSWCTARVLTRETAAKCKDTKNEVRRWRPTERSFDRQFKVGTRGWNANECRVTCCLQTTQNPANIHQSMIWSDDDNNQAALPKKASYFCLQSCEFLRTHTSLGQTTREKEHACSFAHARGDCNSHSRDFSNSSRKIRKLASFSLFYLIFRI